MIGKKKQGKKNTEDRWVMCANTVFKFLIKNCFEFCILHLKGALLNYVMKSNSQ